VKQDTIQSNDTETEEHDEHLDFVYKSVEKDIISQIDVIYGGLRGLLEGYKRGFYKEYSYELSPQCFGEESEVNGYRVVYIIKNEQWV